MGAVLVAGLALLFASVLVALAASGMFTGSRSRRVVRSLAAIEALNLSPQALRQQELQRPFAERVLDPALRRFVSVGNRITPGDRLQRIRRRLDLAGNPAGWDAERVVGLKGLGGLAGLVLGGLTAWALGSAPLPWTAVTVLGGLFGWFIPTMWVYQLGHDRSEQIRRELPDAMDLLTISVEAGLAFDAALAQVARKSQGPLAREFSRVLQEMQIGTGRLDALRALADRTDVSELRTLVGAMVQADGLGIPVASVLRVQSRQMRVKRTQLAEEKAQKVPVKVLFPLIFCIMPTLFIVILGPAVITMIQRLGRR